MNSIPTEDIYARRRRIALVVVALIIGAMTPSLVLMLALIIYGFFESSDVGSAIMFWSLPVIGAFGFVFLTILSAILLKKNVQNPIHFGLAGATALFLVYLLFAHKFHVVVPAVLNALIFVAMGVVSGFVFWAIAVRKKTAFD